MNGLEKKEKGLATCAGQSRRRRYNSIPAKKWAELLEFIFIELCFSSADHGAIIFILIDAV